MATKTVNVCDYVSHSDGTACTRIAEHKCAVCENDTCSVHTGGGLSTLVRNRNDLCMTPYRGILCDRCADLKPTAATEQSLRSLLAPLRDQIIEILRAQQTAEALK